MIPLRISLAVTALALLLLHTACAAPEVDLNELKRLPPVEAKDALKTFKVRSGFRLELVAAEPLIRDPIEICFDENGRMFVVEMIDYSELRDAKPHLGRIRMLEDTDGDGRFDKSTVFVDDLPWPTGVFWANGGLYVAATPDIWFCRDTNGDGKADTRELVFTGFAIDYAPYATNQLNMQAMLNSLRWGLDNRIHGCTAPNGGEITSPRSGATNTVNVRGRDFAFDPRTLRLAVEAGGGQYGMAFDDRGRRFTCNNSDHIRVFMYDAHYAARNPFFNLPPALQSIAVDGPAAEVFRTSPDEPWRVIRTRWRVSGAVPGIIEGGGRASGYFTSATGLMIYRGDAWPEEYVGDAFIADCGSNLVHRKKVRPDGMALKAERPADEQRTEFLTSTDTWFRPVQLANAPDGSLYVIDMYREIIEHPWSLPPSLKKHLDLNAGNDRGRIYRIVPDRYRQPKSPRLGQTGSAELVKVLEHRNAWHRETAARLLYERQDKAAVPALERLLRESQSPLGRMHALHVLDGLGALNAGHLQQALDDADERVREHAVRLTEGLVGVAPVSRLPAEISEPSPALASHLLRLTNDPSIHVRYQLAFTLGEVSHQGKIPALAAIVHRDAADSWVRAAVLSSLARDSGAMFRELTVTPATIPAGLQPFLRELVQVIGARPDTNDVAAVLDFVAQSTDPALAFALIHGLGEGLQRARAALPAESIRPVIARAAMLAADRSQPAAARVEAVELLALTTFAESGARLLSLLELNEPQTVQLAAMHTLGRFTDAKIGPALTQRWTSLTPRLREETLRVLLARPERATALLQAVEEHTIRRADLASTQIDFLTNHRDAALRSRAIQLLTSATKGTRHDVVTAFQPALSLSGDVGRGKKIFVERCASCHRLGGEGFLLGPDLVSVRNAGKEKMLINILDPSREVLPQYLAYEVETKDDETLQGVLVDETPTAITLRQTYAKDAVIPRANIASIRSHGRSIMPDELEAGLKPQDMADLLEFVGTAER